ncbi:bifunctional RNase H/acid phosphatase [Corynebacterium cystitidis]|uniref:bifunctional RNase H/acid phosphatase n=1 Tax=Corynebacterium cystitidis TaxID=35757 RepID=UPI00211DD2BF|nr:bifunctional RNase H/acid phosphatase [Corynebacterium cystitidis]
MKVTIYADGGSRCNPGVAGSGTVLYDADGDILRTIVYVVGQKASNNVAEYHGLLRGLEAAAELGASDVEVFMDSKLVVEQMSGRWKIKHPDMQKLALAGQKLAREFNSVTYNWVPREKNQVADKLSNDAMDAAARGESPGILGGPVSQAEKPPAQQGTYWSAQERESPSAQERETETGTEYDHEVATHAHWNGIEDTPTRFVLLRHGHTAQSAAKVYSGSSDPELTDVGRDQARRAAEWIAATEKIDVIVSSPMRRAQETAAIVGQKLGLEYETDNQWREMDFGDFENLTRDQAFEQYPEELQKWESSISVAPPNGEAVAAMHRRITSARKKLQDKHPGKTVLVVTHVTPIKSMVRQGLNASGDLFTRMFLDLASISVVEFYPDTAVVRRVNDTAHLIQR